MRKQTEFLYLHRRFLSSYKKNTLAVFLSFALTFLLSTLLLVLLHTNHRIENIDYQTLFTPTDCSIENLTEEQLALLKQESAISHIAVCQQSEAYYRNQQLVYLHYSDNAYMTLTSTLLEGRFPENKYEVVAEKWMLLNLGIEPILGEEFTISPEPESSEERNITVKLVGILSDLPANKSYGTLELFTAPIKDTIRYNIAYLRFREVHYQPMLKQITAKLGFTAQDQEERIAYNPARENYSELFWMDVQLLSVVLFVCMVVFYGVYRIALITREKQYGILRAIGMKRKQVKKMILLELYEIYLLGTPIGIVAGLLIAWLVILLSGDADTIVYLYGEAVRFTPVVPFGHLALLIAVTALLVGLVGYATAQRTMRKPVTELLSSVQKTGRILPLFHLKETGGKLQTLTFLSCKYILRDVKTSCFVLLTICTGVVLFTGLSYQAKILQLHRADTKEMRYLNGQYAMSMLSFGSTLEGITRDDAAQIENLPGVAQIKTCSALPIRIIDDGITRDEAYYDLLNSKMHDYMGFELRGYDGTDQVYRSNLYGYNSKALQELKKYIIAGDFDAVHGPKEDEIILAILSIGKIEDNTITTGWYPEGDKVMQYQVGDRIRVKYRTDLLTSQEDYIHFTDYNAEYLYQEYRVTALVSFPYMNGCDRSNIYPMLITSDHYLKDLVPESCYQCIYIDGEPSMSKAQQTALEQKLIQVGAKSSGVSTRSLISDITRNEMLFRKQLIYICGIALITFSLVLINMVNNLRYRMQARTKEICMLRAIGLSIVMAKKIMMIENGIVGIVSILAAYLISLPILQYLYSLSELELYGHHISFDYKAFLFIAAATLLLCAGLSRRILKEWKGKQILEGIGKVE